LAIILDMSETTIPELQEDIAARLAADEYFADVPVLHERKENVASLVAKAIGPFAGRGGKSGICAIVMSPVATVDKAEFRGALMNIELSVRVLEEVTVNVGRNGTRKAALSVARRIARVLHHYRPDGLAQLLLADNPTIMPVEDPIVGLAYEVRFRTMEAKVEPYLKAATPDLLPSSGVTPVEVSLSTSTVGAEIWYSLDGSHPAPDGVGSFHYSTPVTISEACRLRACAFLTGYIASDTSLGLFT
jgi:hypothetical protein